MSCLRTLILPAMLCLLAVNLTVHGQEQAGQREKAADEVVRINTELVQTNVMVFDREGRFVDGLKPEQFELRVDDKPVSITFFERVVAGSAMEEAQLKALNRNAPDSSAGSTPVKTLARGRTVIFFIDDLHLSLDSVGRTRAAISHFIEHEMKANDQAAIASASGQIGFLQQFDG